MVFYYKTSDPSYHVYVGKDKYENEELIKYGWENDVWFHVDKLSSAHVYLRLKDGGSIDSIPEDVLQDCVQLVKFNSIEGNRMNNVAVVYTYWSNLRKTGDMDVGQVSFHKMAHVKRVTVEKRLNEVVNRLNRTKTEEHPDLAREKTNRTKYLNKLAREGMRKKAEREKQLREQQQKEKEEKSYDRIHQPKDMTSNKDIRQTYTEYEDDFM
ncbi:unnamed protein product [Agarophyton chilense]